MSEKVKVTVVGSNEKELQGDFTFGAVANIGKGEIGAEIFVVGNLSKHQICRLISETVSQIVSSLADDPIEAMMMRHSVASEIRKQGGRTDIAEFIDKIMKEDNSNEESQKE